MSADPVQYAILGLISSRSDGVHGYQLKSDFDSLCGDFWVLNFGHLYRTLDRLEKAGMLEGIELLQSGRPNKKIYRITGAGKKSLDDWLLLPPADPRPLRDELSVKLLFLTASRQEETLALIRSQRASYLKHLARLSKRRSQLADAAADTFVTNLLLLQADMRIRADLAWLDLVEREVHDRFARRA